ncbi:NAD(P)-dependent alcohol dehydrogenase [Micromonospora sp. R77]|uniref:zinc-dependent alcohol dehydrogenase family protein n=1 Tax=Micromonospora sp. R77 TaxID=2925836 RepID=UPI001F620898|nr:NAD(P)-dependent alcohol dehydrogenase [Micromonospora sp. R77]MCI4063865.1 NAD(P)-dependent alcohol dehydrogenase [Micromonospora sp. R77]
MMRSFHVDSGAGIAGLAVREHERPTPGPGEVLVAVRAVSLSFRELMILRGTYVLPVRPDVVPVSDGVGVVVARGPGVDRPAEGERVAAAVFPYWRDGPLEPAYLAQLGGSLDGMLTEYAVLPAAALVPVPTHLSDEEAATLPCAAVTAWNALEGVRAGDVVLTLGSGGVSLFAVQFARLLGARVIATTGDPGKAARLAGLGAGDVVDRRTYPEWQLRVRALTDGRGVDRVVDVVGDLDRSLRSVALAGQVACVGFRSGERPAVDSGLLFAAGATVRPIAIGSRAHFVAMNRAIEANGLRPVIARVFPFDEAEAAFRHYESADPFGKVVITVP